MRLTRRSVLISTGAALLMGRAPIRLARGRHFHAFSSQVARELRSEFRWKLRTVAGVGHDYRGMSAAAARLLYG